MKLALRVILAMLNTAENALDGVLHAMRTENISAADKLTFERLRRDLGKAISALAYFCDDLKG